MKVFIRYKTVLYLMKTVLQLKKTFVVETPYNKPPFVVAMKTAQYTVPQKQSFAAIA